MKRRDFIKGAVALPVLITGCARDGHGPGADVSARAPRVRPGDAGWPSGEQWDGLRRAVGDRLIEIESPLAACRVTPDGTACTEFFKQLENPYFIGDNPALTQTSGWAGAWTSKPSVYAVAAADAADVAAAVDFAREHNLRVVIKGGGHSYQGRSCSEDSLLIWTRAMNQIAMSEDFVPNGCEGTVAPQPAVSVGAGAIWMQIYEAVTTQAGRYVQGGGCTTVGVAGLVQSGGFGSFSKNYGLVASGLLEAEVVTADGVIRIANPCTNPELFWALKGGGGGSMGVVTRVTLKTRELPEFFGAVSGRIRAHSDASYRTLIGRIVTHYNDRLFNPHWGEQIRFETGNILGLHMMFQGLRQEQAEDVWEPFATWVQRRPQDYTVEDPIVAVAAPARRLWDAGFLRQFAPQAIVADDRPGAPPGNILWAGDREQAGQVLHGYRSAWIPASLLDEERRSTLVDALFTATRLWEVSLHVNKGLAGAPATEIAAARNTAMNPAVLDAFALAIVAGEGPPGFPGIAGKEPDLATARDRAGTIDRAMDALLEVVDGPGSYVSESDYFESDWQLSFWGSNYPRLAAVKRAYDPGGLFFVHHGVGSEGWSADGFTPMTAN
ncbi:MAG TPA: FAD-binding oxidoreductase [Vicinamibacteria bacterium]|nr:FAD-binding oxidoreductase [Vicinamibacteria bacterium]